MRGGRKAGSRAGDRLLSLHSTLDFLVRLSPNAGGQKERVKPSAASSVLRLPSAPRANSLGLVPLAPGFERLPAPPLPLS